MKQERLWATAHTKGNAVSQLKCVVFLVCFSATQRHGVTLAFSQFRCWWPAKAPDPEATAESQP
jgi:hypothetical protein